MANPCVYQRIGGVWVMQTTCQEVRKEGDCVLVPNSTEKLSDDPSDDRQGPIRMADQEGPFLTAFRTSLGLAASFTFEDGARLEIPCDRTGGLTATLYQGGAETKFVLEEPIRHGELPTVHRSA